MLSGGRRPAAVFLQTPASIITLRRPQMDHAIAGTPTTKTVLYGALELSKNTWLLALQLPDRVQPSCIRSEVGIQKGLWRSSWQPGIAGPRRAARRRRSCFAT